MKGNPEFLLSCFNSPNEFTLRNLRNAFFKFRVQIFGEVSETEIKDIVVFQHSEIKHSSFMTLAICRMVGGELLSQTIPSVFRLNKEIAKIKIIVSSRQLEAGFKKTLTNLGFVEELLIRSFEMKNEKFYSYAIFRNEEVAV